MTRTMRLVAGLLVVGSLVAAACGTDDNGTVADDTTTTAPGDAPDGDLTNAEIAQCVDPNASEPQAGDEMVFVWGGGLTGVRVEEHIAPAFEAATGVQMFVVGEAGGDTMSKIVAGGGRAEYDVVFTSHATLEIGRAAGVLSTYDFSRMPSTEAYPENLLDPGGDDIAITITEFAYGLAYNTEVLEERGLPVPTSVEDVLDPQYGDIVGLFTPPFQSAVAQIAIVNAILGGPTDDPTTGIEALVALDQARRVSSTSELNTMVADGTIGMWFSASATAQELVDEGLPIEMIGNPAYFSGIYVVVPTGSGNPGAACLFANWVVSDEGQAVLPLVNGNLPTRPGVPPRADSILVPLAEDERNSYPDLIADLPSIEAVTEQWNQAARG